MHQYLLAIDGLSSYAQELLSSEREKIVKTLLRRCQAKYGTVSGAQRFVEVIGLVDSFCYFNAKRKDLHITVCMMTNREKPASLLYVMKQ